MKSIRISGVNASGEYKGKPNLAFIAKKVNLDIPLDELGNTDPSVTLSGQYTGAMTFHSDNNNIEQRFQPNEDIYITSSNFSGDYSATVNYIEAGDMTSYMQTDISRVNGGIVPNFWRYR